MQHYPKVLLVCNFNQRTANGITIKNLFRHWPKDKIAVADYSSDISEIYSENIANYYIIGKEETKHIAPFNLFFNPHPSGEYYLTKAPASAKNEIQQKNKTSIISKLKTAAHIVSLYLLHATGLAFVVKRFSVSSVFKTWVRDKVNPDIVYVSGSSVSIIRFAEKLKKELKTKLVFHVFDDFLGSGKTNILPLIKLYWLYKLNKTYRSLIAKADLNFVISDKMSEVYQQKYGRKFYSFHNPIDEGVWLKNATLNQNKKNEFFLFVYTGKINHDTAPVLKFFLDNINSLNSNGYNIKLHIYTQTSYSLINSLVGELPPETFKGFLKNNLLPAKLKNADGLLLPLSFAKRSKKYTWLSVATKTTEYLVSNTPILLFAPEELAVTEYLDKHNAAYVVTDKSRLTEAITDFVGNRKTRTQVASNAYNLAITRHLSENITEEIRKLFASIINSKQK